MFTCQFSMDLDFRTGAKRREFSGMIPHFITSFMSSSQQPPAIYPATLRLARTSTLW